jgi:glycosyltransferase involved in cell wall biosynthesis
VTVGRTDWDKRIMKIFAPMSRYYHCDEILREEFYNYEWEIPNAEKFIFVSTLSPVIYKGLETVLSTASLLNSRTGFNFEWHICGINGFEEVVKIVEKSARKRFESVNVKFLGKQTSEELAHKLANSHCFVHPSHIENSPNSICEAMMVGTPIIGTYAGGTPTILLNGEEGVLVQAGDPYAMAGAMIEMINSPERMIFYSENARKRAIKRHNPDTIVNSLINIYKEVLEST